MFLSSVMQTNFLMPIIILLGISSLTTILISVFKIKFLPTFAIEIIVGLLIARWFNKYISANNFASILDGIYVLGLSFIMFLSGYDVELEVLEDKECTSKKHINIFKLCTQITLVILILSIIVAVPFSFFILKTKSVQTIALLGIVFSSCFAGLVSPLIHDQGLLHSVIGKIFAVFADISELLSVLFLSIFMIATRVSQGYVWVLLVILFILTIWRIIPTKKVVKIFGKATGGIVHFPTRIIVLLTLGLTVLSEMAGGEYILGAFLAGILAQVTGFKREVLHLFTRMVYGIFAPMFFIIVGTKIDIFTFFANTENILYLIYIIVALLIVRLPMLYLLKWFKANTLIPMILLNASTIIVCIAAQHIGHSLHIFSHEFGEALILAGILSSVVTPIIFKLKFIDGGCDEKCQMKFND